MYFFRARRRAFCGDFWTCKITTVDFFYARDCSTHEVSLWLLKMRARAETKVLHCVWRFEDAWQTHSVPTCLGACTESIAHAFTPRAVPRNLIKHSKSHDETIVTHMDKTMSTCGIRTQSLDHRNDTKWTPNGYIWKNQTVNLSLLTKKPKQLISLFWCRRKSS